jgi:hypothetical protein
MKPRPGTKADTGCSLQRMVRRLDELGERSAGELGQDLWLKEYRGIPENRLATRYCRPAGKLLKAAEQRGWVTSREGRNRRLWRVTPAGRFAAAQPPNDPSSAMTPTQDIRLQPEREGVIRCSAWLGGRKKI